MSDCCEVTFSRSKSGAEVLGRLIGSAGQTIVAALYRLSSPALVSALREAGKRGVAIRLCLNDNDHYEENQAAQAALRRSGVAFRLLHGYVGAGSKMHHKFAVIDNRTAVTGSYNWTMESEERNYENLLAIYHPATVAAYAEEFEALWKEGRDPDSPAL